MKRHIRGFRGTLLLCCVAVPACQWPTSSTDSHSGLTSVIRVEDAQPMRGSVSEPANSIPATASVRPQNSTIFPGAGSKSIRGSVGPDVNAVAIGVAGDGVYWLVPALNPDVTDPHSFTFNASLSISPSLASSPLLVKNADGTATLSLSARAVDASGNFGPASIQPLTMDPQALAGTLIVSLSWDAPVDLDLHVLVPAANDLGYVEVWSKARSANPTIPDGVLDFDSNASCQIDGRDLENVVWTGQPPAGHYIVRVDLASLCGQTSAAWHAVAYSSIANLGEASGVLTEAATRQNPAAGAGLTVIDFDYP